MKQTLVGQLKKHIAMVAAMALMTIAGSALTFRPAEAMHDEAENVRDVLVQSVTAFERGDMTTMNKVWANDESLTVFEQGHANYGWADYRDNHLAPEMKEMKNTKYTLSDIRVKVSGATAWATFKYAISADVEGRHMDGGGLGTSVLEKRDGRWQIVHWHSSAPRRTPAAAGTPRKN